MVKIYILIEQAIGYGLLRVNNCKSTDDLLTILNERNVQKLLSSHLELLEFQPFSSAANAALNCVDIANGVVSEDLARLLKAHLSEGKSVLVVSDKKLIESLKAANINADLSCTAENNLVFGLREIRQQFHVILKDDEKHLVQAHIGLGHGYSRIKIKYNVNRADNMIIQTINLLDQLDRDVNTVAMRLREWFGYHYPELSKIVPEAKMYARIVQLIKSRAGAVESNAETLETILQDSAKAQAIVDSAKTSMGYELTDEDFVNIGAFADKLLLMGEQRDYTVRYLRTKMAQVAPSFSALVGDVVAARLISHAGSLVNLAKFPASTIQILGAEKALFRAIKSRGNTPKYGLIFHSSFIGRAAKQDKGRVSRFLAAKISLAVRLDCFMDDPVSVYGEHLRRHVEDQLVYLETGKEPKKNYEMMEAAVKDAKEFVAKMKADEEKKKNEVKEEPLVVAVAVKKEKKAKKRLTEEVKEQEQLVDEPEKKKKKKALKEEDEATPVAEVAKKVKKEKKDKTVVVEAEVKVEAAPVEEGKKKVKKEKKKAVQEAAPVAVEEVVPEKKMKKEKKRAAEEVKVEEAPIVSVEAPTSSKKKKKKNKQ